MDDSSSVIDDRQPVSAPVKGQSSGCLQSGALIFMTMWILIASVIALGATWFLEQAMLEGSFDVPDIRWLITLGYGLAVLLPSAAVWAFWRHLPVRNFYLAFALAAAFALILTPTRLIGITAANETAAAQILLIGLFLLLARLLLPRSIRLQALNWHGLGLALLAAAAVGIPWLLWGALGSPLNMLLNLLAALMFGLAASRVLGQIFWPSAGAAVGQPNVMFNGFGAFLVLTVMAFGLGVNGNQMLLSAVIPVLGWALAGLASARLEMGNRGVSVNGPVLALLAGLAAFWPMAFVDPDELAVSFTLGLGELIQWSLLAAFVSLLVGLAASALIVPLSRLVRRAGSALMLTAAGLVWIGAGIVYFVLGQPGFYGDRLFVILTDQADLSAAAQMDDFDARRAYVYQTLVDHAVESQADLRRELDGWGIAYQPYYLENALEVDWNPLLRYWLERRPEVERVVDSPILRPLPREIPQSTGAVGSPSEIPWNLRMIGADRVWQELNITGEGIIIGQADTGVQADHTELADSYRGRDGAGHDFNWFDPWYHTTTPYDISGHGTHTLGTVLGNQVGVAPDAEWIGCVNLGRNLGNPALYLDCMQFTFAPFPLDGDPFTDGQPAMGAHITNNSWGCPQVEGCDPFTLAAAVDALRAAGIFVVSSVGNDGYGGCETVNTPIALFAEVYSVGAISRDGALAPFSSKGPVVVDGSGRMKPDIAAPGVDIVSAYPGGTYLAASGTSMAGPHVAGVVALMWSANPALIGQIERTEQILNQTAAPYTGPLPECILPGSPNNAVGHGLLDAFEAVQQALQE
jgi:subtilisin family serine protease